MDRSAHSARIVILLVVAALAAALGGSASPVAAAASEHGYGAEARCRYTATQSGQYGWTEALLKRIVVMPPTVFAKKAGGQQVGWRFIVRRSLDREAGPWKVSYRSRIQKAPATKTSAADFSKMGVEVSVPTNVEDQNDVWYRVTLKIFWYRADGSVDSSTTYLFTQYRMYVDGKDQGVWSLDDYCPGLALQFFDGP